MKSFIELTLKLAGSQLGSPDEQRQNGKHHSHPELGRLYFRAFKTAVWERWFGPTDLIQLVYLEPSLEALLCDQTDHFQQVPIWGGLCGGKMYIVILEMTPVR